MSEPVATQASETMQASAPAGGATMLVAGEDGATLRLEPATAALVAASAGIAAGSEALVRQVLRQAHGTAPAEWMEEVVLQSYLFAGFPRALNAMRLWRAISGTAGPACDSDPATDAAAWSARGEATCAAVYGRFYHPLRTNIAALHPALDAWMVVEGYGKVLGRPALDLRRRELCVVAACAAAQQERQLHSHLHGALHVGAAPAEVAAALEVALATVAPLLDGDAPRRYRQLWGKVLGQHAAAGSTTNDGRD
jgi:4-carboxymuconolactone decarboxylase